ncbi:hypothetical protein ABEX47_12660 [Paenibacillus ehimensis]|uniref:hypothetical protein n=1 Tax=Paenibacillus ehimensis TaxID=79264 RepID=UPI000FDCC2FB|nr:hypothetical protein [Paenibacillus ehimensis]MEC0210052.1 hypothetical protein [Paenibacillus ehimensis]
MKKTLIALSTSATLLASVLAPTASFAGTDFASINNTALKDASAASKSFENSISVTKGSNQEYTASGVLVNNIWRYYALSVYTDPNSTKPLTVRVIKYVADKTIFEFTLRPGESLHTDLYIRTGEYYIQLSGGPGSAGYASMIEKK